MNRSHIVHGPTGCGKTRNAERIAAALGLSKVQDNWSPMDQVFEPFDTLYLTASEGPWPDQARHVLSFAEAMGRVPDAVVEPKSRYIHRNGVEYEVVMIANGESTSPKYPPTIVYRGVANGKVWARPACDWDRSMQLVERPASAKVEGTEQVSSTWLAQLRSEYRQFAGAVETLQAKLQSTLARVAELERALQTVVNAADHGSWPTTVMHGIEVAREVLAGPSAQTQPSPAPTLRAAIDVANDRFEVPVAKWGTDLIGEEGRPKVVARLYRSNAKYFPPFAEVQKPLPPGDGTLTVDPLITLAQYDRDVGTLRAANAKLEKELAMARDAEAQALREEVAARRARVVVVPERKSGQSTIPGLHMNRGWNACLDELARLNGKVVSEADIFASVQAVRDRYPVVVFPSDGASVDCKSAAMARVVCDAVMKELSTLLASSEES